MLKSIALGALAASLLAAPALARDGVSFHRNDNRNIQPQRHNRSGAWIGNNHGHFGGPHGRHGGGLHDHFSPRGTGGHHWGW